MVVQSSFSATLFILMQLMSLIAGASSQVHVANGDCVCAPRQFLFRLDLSGVCPQLPPPFPPNDVFGAGVQNYACYLDYGAREEVLLDSTTSSTTTPSRTIRRRMQDGIFQLYNSTVIKSEESPPIEGADTTPVVIESILINEFDTAFRIVNTAYSNVEFQSGDVFCYTSLSEVNPSVVIGGIRMTLHGRNSDNEPLVHVVFVAYTNVCGVSTFEEGDAIGWVVFEKLVPASEERCPGLVRPSSSPTQSKTAKTAKPTSFC